MIKRVISLMALILLNISGLTLCVGPEQTPPTQTTTIQNQRNRQNFERLLGNFRQKDQELDKINTQIKTVQSLNSNVTPFIYGLISAGISGGICYLRKQPRLKIGLYSAAFGLTAILGTKLLQWFRRKTNPKLNNLEKKESKRNTALGTLEDRILEYNSKFDLQYINSIYLREKCSLLRSVISRLLPKVKRNH